MRVRELRADEFARLQAIEVAAGAVFRVVDLHDVADDEPPTAEELEGYRAGGRAWVAVDEGDVVAAYVLVDLLDGAAHIEQVSVHPDHARQRVGRALIDHVAAWARRQGMGAMTLTTFRDVPWNAPYYERCGFVVLSEEELGPQLRARRDAETAHGLDPSIRVCMRKEIQLPR